MHVILNQMMPEKCTDKKTRNIPYQIPTNNCRIHFKEFQYFIIFCDFLWIPYRTSFNKIHDYLCCFVGCTLYRPIRHSTNMILKQEVLIIVAFWQENVSKCSWLIKINMSILINKIMYSKMLFSGYIILLLNQC